MRTLHVVRARGRRPALVILLLAAAWAPRAAGADDRGECEYGITLALLGRAAAAESVFTSLLSHAPGDARALNNLGNLAMLRGEVPLALAFYGRAGEADTADAGITLNQATALLLLGDEEQASVRAADGVRGAGGARAAAGLLGLRYAATDVPKAADRAYLGKDEVLDMLRAAAGRVPADTTRAASDSTTTRTKKRAPAWRSAGARAGATADASMLVYWKH